MDEATPEHTYLYKKIDTIENRLESHVTKIEQKLEQLVSIFGAVAALQEREVRNSDTIKELKSSIKDSLLKTDRDIAKIHDRIDVINKIIEGGTVTQAISVKDIETHISKVNDEVVKWRERGIGLWVGITALIFSIQIMGGYILKSFDDAYKVTKTQVLDMSRRQLELEKEVAKANDVLLNKNSPK